MRVFCLYSTKRLTMTRSFITLLLSLLMFSETLSAQQQTEADVLKRVEALRRAMVDADAKALDDLTADKLSYGHSNGIVEDKKRFREKLVTGESDFLTMDLTELTVTVSGRTALVRCRLEGKTSDGGKSGQAKLHVLMVWQKQGGSWKLLARQATKLL